MTSILSTISGYFSKHLILGSFLPVVIFIILAWLLLVPILPGHVAFFQPLAGLDKEWKIVAITFTAIVLSGLLYNLNIQILQLFQGYPWKDSWLGKRRTRHFKKRFNSSQVRIQGLRALLRAIDTATSDFAQSPQLIKKVVERLTSTVDELSNLGTDDKTWLRTWLEVDAYDSNILKDRWIGIRERVLNEYTRTMQRVRNEYPSEEWLLMPTRLGNLIRSFEYYPKREYGIDGNEMWPRLVAQIAPDYALTVDDAKISFDFMMNCSMLSGLLSLTFLITGLIHPSIMSTKTGFVFLLLKTGIFACLSFTFYEFSVSRAAEWGRLVKSAFDLYRWKLLDQLGFKQSLTTKKAERELWGEISRQTIYGDPFARRALLDYADAQPKTAPYASSKQDIELEITRGIQLVAHTETVNVFVSVRNIDPARAAEEVVITDKLPEGFYYEWDSAAVDHRAVIVTGANPFRFKVEGQLAASQSLTLTYRAIPPQASQKHNVGFRFGTP